MICLNDNKYILYAFDHVLATLYPIIMLYTLNEKGIVASDGLITLGKGHEDYLEIEGKKYHFSEHEVIAEIVEDIKAGRLEMEDKSLRMI